MPTPKLIATIACTLLCVACGHTFTDPRDKKTYKTIKIGKQTWLAENLNYEAEGSKCYGEGGKVWNKEAESFDIPLSNIEIKAICEKYGKLYNWVTAMKVCPNGWHLPSNAEWEVLTIAVGGGKTEGKYLKATSGWNLNSGEDKFGFSALPGGGGYTDGYFLNIGDYGRWWSSSENNSKYAYSIYIHLFGQDVYYYSDNDKDDLYSVRCIQNTTKPQGKRE